MPDLTLESFADKVGDRFILDVDGTDSLVLTLATATPGSIPPPDAGRRAPFSLVFHGSLQPVLPQRIYRLEHDELGALELFLVPIGPEGESMRYEAVFG